MNGSTNQIVWKKELGLNQAHGVTPLATASDLLFMILTDGNLVAWDAATGQEVWRFQTGVSGSSGVISYMIGGEQYIAVLAAAIGIPYNPAEGDNLWAFKLGGTAKYVNAAGAVVSGSSEAPTPPPLVIRRPVGNTAASTLVPANTILLARSNGTATATKDSTATGAMVPSTLTVPVRTAVTFLNPDGTTFPTNPTNGNAKVLCATQFFEGLFNPSLNPGQSFVVTFNKAGEYFYNDCTDPRPTGKVVATLTPNVLSSFVKFLPGAFDMRPTNGVFTAGLVGAVLNVPQGYVLDGGAANIKLVAPLSSSPITAVTASVTGNGQTLLYFNKRDIANNVPAGSGVPVSVSGIFTNGVQAMFTQTAMVTVQK